MPVKPVGPVSSNSTKLSTTNVPLKGVSSYLLGKHEGVCSNVVSGTVLGQLKVFALVCAMSKLKHSFGSS